MREIEQTGKLTAIVGGGVMLIVLVATLAGVMQLAMGKGEQDAPKLDQTARKVEPDNATLERIKRERDDALRKVRENRAQAAHAREEAAAMRAQYKNARCIDGILFAEVKGEVRNVSRCDQE